MPVLGERFYQMSNTIFCYDLKPIPLAVYSYLVCCAGQKDVCWPSMKTIALHCGCSENAARDAANLLLQGKVIEQDKEEGIQWLTLAAEQGHSYAQCLLERQSASTAPEVFLAVTRLLHHMANIFQDNSLPQSGTGLIHADRKLREQLREKRLAHGHKVDDHEEQQNGGWNMTMR